MAKERGNILILAAKTLRLNKNLDRQPPEKGKKHISGSDKSAAKLVTTDDASNPVIVRGKKLLDMMCSGEGSTGCPGNGKWPDA